MKPCTYCGSESEDTAIRCPKCGINLEDTRPVSSALVNSRSRLAELAASMTKNQKRAAICVVILLGAVGIYIASGYLHRPRMSMFEVIQIAGNAAQAEGFRLSEYQNPDAKFEFPDRNRTWTVMYNLKLPSPWGPPLPKPQSAHGAPHHFFVTVDDSTKRTRVGVLQPIGNERPASLPPGTKVLGRFTNQAWGNSNAR